MAVLVITPGEPAGIGADVVLQTVAEGGQVLASPGSGQLWPQAVGGNAINNH